MELQPWNKPFLLSQFELCHSPPKSCRHSGEGILKDCSMNDEHSLEIWDRSMCAWKCLLDMFRCLARFKRASVLRKELNSECIFKKNLYNILQCNAKWLIHSFMWTKKREKYLTCNFFHTLHHGILPEM